MPFFALYIRRCAAIVLLGFMTLVVAPHARLAAAQGVNQIHPGFVALDTLDASIVHDIAYYGTDNFIGTPIDGYERSACLLTVEAADALVRANDELRDFGLAIKVFDCYRPQTAVNHFVRWAQQKDDTVMKDRYYPEVNKSLLFDLGYIASRSGHSRGSTVDLTIVRLDSKLEDKVDRSSDCRSPEYGLTGELEMGTGYDCFDELSHTANGAINSVARSNRLLLRLIMEKHGFDNYSREWWHYTYRAEPFRDEYFDFPVR